MRIIQKQFSLPAHRRGFHLITREITRQIPELAEIQAGIAHLHILHTSAGLTLNENADPDVRRDMESIFNHLVPEHQPYYVHTMEGPDDMPAHAKSSLLGHSVTIPVTDGRLNLGTWQGIYLCEHRNHGGSRRFVLTVLGE
ncbi:secondary thiamine-phosphate synthase enzyme YjbQ [Spirochaeta africana]|nr:secondary thiamine-phosphate synthase enzyme YjbQ [Spirochaeta africana]